MPNSIPALLGLLASAAASLVLLCGPNPALALLPPVGLVLLAILAWRPEYGYFTIVALIPLSAWRVLSEQYPFFTVSKFVGICVVAIIVARTIRRDKDFVRLRSRLWVLLAGFFAISLISSLCSRYWVVSFNDLRQMATAILFFGMTLYFVDGARFRTTIPWLLVISGSVAAFIGVMGALFSIEDLMVSAKGTTPAGRVVGGATDPNFFGAMLLASLPLLAHFCFSAKSNRRRILLSALLIHNSCAIWLTYSRGVMLVFAVVACLLVLELLKRIRARHLGFVLMPLALIALIAIYTVPQTVMWERMMSFKRPLEDASLSRRATYLAVGWGAMLQRPLIGWGPGTFPRVYESSDYAGWFATDEMDFARVAHNTYLDVGVGQGFLGLLLFLILLGLSFRYYLAAHRRMRKTRPEDAALVRAYVYGFFSFMMSLLFLSHVYHKYIWMFLALGAVALTLARQEEEAVE